MKTALTRFLLFSLILLSSSVIQWVTTVHLIAYVPAIFLSTIIITWTIPFSWPYLAALAIGAELYTSLPPGFMTVVVVAPLVIYRLRTHIEPDVSFSFLALTILTVILQVGASFAYDLNGFHWSQLPWQLLGTLIVSTSLVAYISILGILNVLPQSTQSIISFDSYNRYARRHR